MKFSNEHFESLKQTVKELNIDIPVLNAECKAKGQSETRFLWDLFWASGWTKKEHKHYYEGDYMDSHITTAMKQVVKDLSAVKVPF